MLIFTGPLIGNLVNEMELKIKGELNETFHFYSGHDTTISVLLTALDIYNGIPPPYSTSVIIELRQKDEDYVVTVKKNPLPKNYLCTYDDWK